MSDPQPDMMRAETLPDRFCSGPNHGAQSAHQRICLRSRRVVICAPTRTPSLSTCGPADFLTQQYITVRELQPYTKIADFPSSLAIIRLCRLSVICSYWI